MLIAICDDSLFDRELMIDMFTAYFAEKGITAEIARYENGIQLCREVEDGAWYDMIFLDTFTEDMLGIDIAVRLRNIGYNGKIVFTAISDDFAVASYNAEASGYILKPYSYSDIVSLLDRITKHYKAESFKVWQRNRCILIPKSEIIYIESENSKCILHRTDNRCYNIYQKLDSIELELSDPQFLRSHHSYLVNMNYIQQVDKAFLLTNGDMVMIRQRDIRQVKDIFRSFLADKKHNFCM